MFRFFLIVSLAFSLILFLIPQVLYAVGWLVARLLHHALAWRPFLVAGLALVVLWWGLYAYGHWIGRFRFEVKKVELGSSRLPSSFDGYRIVQISDLHADGWKGHARRLQEIADTINALKPDLIVFTGDLVSFDFRELFDLWQPLASLRARDGVLSVLGNHDYDPYARNISPERRDSLVRLLVSYQEEQLGWRVLMNSNTLVRRGSDSLAIVGVENQSCGPHRPIRRGRLADAMKGTDGMFRVLLSHDPSHWRAEVLGRTDIDLTLSGHTHAMQCRILGFTPSRFIYPECDGLYREGDQSLYVNIGLGGTMPMRIGATPEVTLITLRR